LITLTSVYLLITLTSVYLAGLFKANGGMGEGLMWTMVDGQADHSLTHNRPRDRASGEIALRAQ
ncbi:hypothetical protein, partial [Vibrio cincinnatiensis]|uniref:hypothetical protein n=1 Tax=Vibrio cincinnatiensis TaxID=675 RepID=UPI001EDFF455